MLAENIIFNASYDNAVDFIKKTRNWEECKEIFGEDIKEIEKSKLNNDDKIMVLFEHLNSYGWTDEEIIKEFLKRDKKTWWLMYVDDGNNGYFDLYGVLNEKV